jgi:thiamine pyrophosphokinase
MAGRALIFIGGEAPPRERILPFLTDQPLIIAADSGLEVAQLYDIQPDLVIGDMDSVSDQALTLATLRGRSEIKRFPVDKDYTDTELALRYAWERDVAQTILIGGGGGRLDHLLGLWRLFGQDRFPNRWYTATDEVRSISGTITMDLRVGTVLSFFGFGPVVRATSQGLRWNLDGLRWQTGDAGISNRSTGPVQVSVQVGRLVMVRQLTDVADQVS